MDTKMSRKVNPRSMRRENRRIVLRHLIESGPKTRLSISRYTGLAHSVIWRIVNELQDEGYIEEKGTVRRGKRRATLYGPSSNYVSSLIFNVEVKKTVFAIGKIDGSWDVIDTFETEKSFEKFVYEVKNRLRNVNKKYKTGSFSTKLVFSIPGIVKKSESIVVKAPNIGWKNVDFGTAFEGLGMDVIVGNDADFSLLSEAFFSKDIRKKENVFFLYFGQGVGGGILRKGEIVWGEAFSAGEVGHVRLGIDDGKEVEDYLSIIKLIDSIESVHKLPGETPLEKFKAIKEIWKNNDPMLKPLLSEFAENIALLLRNVIYTLNPGAIVLGGIVTGIWETFGEFIENMLKRDVDEFLLDSTIIRDSTFRDVPSSLPGCNVVAIQRILKEI